MLPVMSETAPYRFAAWMSAREHRDRKIGRVYRYHPRSDAHSVRLCTCVIEDLLASCALLRSHLETGRAVYGINVPYEAASTHKRKTLDLAIGATRVSLPAVLALDSRAESAQWGRLLFSCEAKSVMTEHSKSQPRVYDELSSSHEIVHQGDPQAIAAGLTVVNISDAFVSPLRQTVGADLYVTHHRQPHAASRMVQHLRGLPIRNRVGEVGFDAYCTVVIDCDNQGEARIWDSLPAPQPGDPDHYLSFMERIVRFYEERFASLD
jgi:hypothetical protein